MDVTIFETAREADLLEQAFVALLRISNIELESIEPYWTYAMGEGHGLVDSLRMREGFATFEAAIQVLDGLPLMSSKIVEIWLMIQRHAQYGFHSDDEAL